MLSPSILKDARATTEHSGYIEDANCCSRLIFVWAAPFFRMSGRFAIADFPLTREEDKAANLAERLGAAWEEELQTASRENRYPSLYSALLHTFGWSYFVASLLLSVNSGCRILGVLAVGWLVQFLQNEDEELWQGAVYAAILGLATGCAAMMHHSFFWSAWHHGMEFRHALTALVMRKILRTSVSGLRRAGSGKVVNIVSQDLERLQRVATMVAFLWMGPPEIIAIAVVLYLQVGAAAFAGLAALALLVPLQGVFARLFGSLRASAASLQDKRVQLARNVIAGIRMLKVFAWEGPMARRIAGVRAKEVEKIASASVLRAMNEALFGSMNTIVAAATFLVASAALGETLSTQSVLVTLGLFNLLQLVAAKFIPLAIEFASESATALRRLTEVLVLPEKQAMATGAIENVEGEGEGAAGNDGEGGSAPIVAELRGVFARWGEDDDGEDDEDDEDDGGGRYTPQTAGDGQDRSNSGRYSPSGHAWTLSNVSFTARQGQLHVVVGAVGSGKSSLLMTLLGELPTTAGSASLRCRSALSPQQPWVVTGTLRDNVVAGRPFDEARYWKVLWSCGLMPDLKLLERCDFTRLGNRGVNLSGGQQARVSLARACYGQEKAVLLDDPLSAVDSKVGRLIVERCIQGLLLEEGRCVVLATHQLHLVSKADAVSVMHRGVVVSQGAPEEVDLTVVRADLEEEGEDVEDVEVQVHKDGDASTAGAAGEAAGEAENKPSAGTGAGAGPAHLEEVDLDDIPVDGAGRASPGATGAGGGDASPMSRDRTYAGKQAQEEVAAVRAISAAAGAAADSEAAREAKENNAETSADRAAAAAKGAAGGAAAIAAKSYEQDASDADGSNAGKNDVESGKGSSLVKAEGKEAGAVTWSTYLTYFSAAGGPCQLLATAFLLVSGTVMVVFTQFWITEWAGQSRDDQQTGYWWGSYSGLAAGTVVLSAVRTTVFFLGAVASSRALHDRMMAALLRAPLTHYDANPAGRILNRVSKDVGFVDDLMPMTSFDFLNIALLVVVATATVCVANPYLLICALPFLGVLVWLRGFFLQSAREIKRLEAVSRSQVFGSLAEALDGVVPARALGLEPTLAKHSDAALDLNARAYFMFLVASRWLGYRLDLMCVGFNAATAIGCIFLRGQLDAGLVGLSLTLALQLTSVVQWCMRQSAELEQQMISVERLLEYARLPQEDVDLDEEQTPGNSGDVSYESSGKITQRAGSRADLLSAARSGTSRQSPQVLAAAEARKALRLEQSKELFGKRPGSGTPPSDWPAVPAIQLRNMWMRYRTDLPWVLRGVTADIPAGSKVGIVGRSGAGKSTLIQALLRLYESEPPPAGAELDGVTSGGEWSGISIGGHLAREVPLSLLRRSVAVITQEPALFRGSLRDNLDPFSTMEDAQLLHALDRVQLGQWVKEDPAGLGRQVDDGGSNMSAGQRQLVALARAVLRRAKVLILDEPSSFTDERTDAALQQAVREDFADATVITIAHRLDTVLDGDLVAVMHAGKVVEFGPPAALLAPEQESEQNGPAEGKSDSEELNGARVTGYLRSLVEATGSEQAERLRAIASAGNRS